LVGAASTAAGAEHLFHGGYLISSLVVVAYAFDIRYTVGASIALVIEQVLMHQIDGRGVVPAVGSMSPFWCPAVPRRTPDWEHPSRATRTSRRD
jgi:hypothetical protein